VSKRLALLAGLWLLPLAAAQAEGFTVGGRVGTLGVGIEIRQPLSPSFGVRAGINGLAYALDFTYDDVDYDVQSSLAVPQLLLDWRPMQGKFRITAGAAYYNEVGNLEAVPSPCCLYQIGNTYYTAAQIGVLKGKSSFHTPAPYLGVGWDILPRRTGNRGFGFDIDVGALYRNRPDVWLNASGGGVSGIDLLIERENIRGDTLTFHLVVSVGLSYHF